MLCVMVGDDLLFVLLRGGVHPRKRIVVVAAIVLNAFHPRRLIVVVVACVAAPLAGCGGGENVRERFDCAELLVSEGCEGGKCWFGLQDVR